jgi:hypothetical protein
MSTLQIDGSAPYAPPRTVIQVIERFRSNGLPQPLTAESIQRVGVTESLAPRVVATLKLFGLIDDDGKVTSQFEDLRRVPTPDYKPTLTDLLRSVYAEVFTVVDPSTATYQQVHDAFRQFTPRGQIDRMVMLFLGLLEFAEYSDSLPKPQGGAGNARPAASRMSTPNPLAPAKTTPPRVVSPATPRPAGRGYYTTALDLGNAGHVELTVNINPLLLDKIDRDFFFGLVDQLEAWRAAKPPTGNSQTGKAGTGGV